MTTNLNNSLEKLSLENNEIVEEKNIENNEIVEEKKKIYGINSTGWLLGKSSRKFTKRISYEII